MKNTKQQYSPRLQTSNFTVPLRLSMTQEVYAQLIAIRSVYIRRHQNKQPRNTRLARS